MRSPPAGCDDEPAAADRDVKLGQVTLTRQKDAKQLLEFMRRHRLAVAASVTATSTPQAAVVGIAVTDRFELVFDTLESSGKPRPVGAMTAGTTADPSSY